MRLHAADTLHNNAALQFSDKMDLLQNEETAFLIEKSNQQSFLTLMAGTILTGLQLPDRSCKLLKIKINFCRSTLYGTPNPQAD